MLNSIGTKFFPYADKDILYIDVANEKVDNIDSTSDLVKQVEDIVKSDEDVTSYTSAIGGAVPKFYITIPPLAPAKDKAQIMMNIDLNKTKKFSTRQELAEYLQSQIDSKISGGIATVKLLEQAMPTGAPIRIRLTGDDLEKLYSASDQIQEKLNGIPGTTNVRDDAAKRLINMK